MTDQRETERARITRLLRKLDIKPTKALGQNFLIDRSVIVRTVELAAIDATDTVLEIGPGLGMLTRELSARCRELVLVELDRDLANYLRGAYVSTGNVRIVEADARYANLGELGLGPATKVVANLPYSVGTIIVRRLLDADPRPQTLTVMLQREVAERMAAGPPDMSLLALAVQSIAVPEIAFMVPPNAFWPEPNVESAVIQLTVHRKPLVAEPARTALFRVASAAFRAKRKTLTNSLSVELRMDKSYMSTILAESGIDPMARPQHVALAQWIALMTSLGKHGVPDA